MPPCSRCRQFDGAPSTIDPHRYMRVRDRVSLSGLVRESYECIDCESLMERHVVAQHAHSHKWRLTWTK